MTSGELPTLTRAESEVMGTLWRLERATVHDVVAALERPAAYTTVLTVLRTLEKKGYARHEPDPAGGRAYLYVPAVEEQRARGWHVNDLVERLFAGRPNELALGLVDGETLSRRDLEELRARIEARLGEAHAPKHDGKKARKESKR